MTKDNLNLRKNILFIGNLGNFNSLAWTLTGKGYEVSYFSIPENVIGCEKIDLIIFEKSNWDIILDLKTRRKTLPVLLMDYGDYLSKKRITEYQSLNVDVLHKLDNLFSAIDYYLVSCGKYPYRGTGPLRLNSNTRSNARKIKHLKRKK